MKRIRKEHKKKDDRILNECMPLFPVMVVSDDGIRL